jgi:uncharacterized FAD-dependent dehydrogenase
VYFSIDKCRINDRQRYAKPQRGEVKHISKDPCIITAGTGPFVAVSPGIQAIRGKGGNPTPEIRTIEKL